MTDIRIAVNRNAIDKMELRTDKILDQLELLEYNITCKIKDLLEDRDRLDTWISKLEEDISHIRRDLENMERRTANVEVKQMKINDRLDRQTVSCITED